MDKTTTQLMNEELENIKEFSGFNKKYEQKFIATSLTKHLMKILIEKNLEKADVIKKSGMQRNYGYQIFNGTRNPSRVHLTQLAFGLKLNSKEANKLFRVAGLSPLYSKVRSEAAAMFCLNKGYSYLDYTLFLDSLD